MTFTECEELFEKDHQGIRNLITYNSDLDDDIVAVLRSVQDINQELYYTHVAKKLGLSENYVELILHVTGLLGLTEYGCSPRGSWTTEKGDRCLEFLDKEKLK